MPSLASFYVHTDAYPRICKTDELMIVHRDQIVPPATLYIGAHQTATFEVRTAANSEAVESATPAAYSLTAGGKMKLELTSPLLAVAKITPLTGQIYVWIASMGEFSTHLKQYNVPSI